VDGGVAVNISLGFKYVVIALIGCSSVVCTIGFLLGWAVGK
jgi:hypothetical protein